MRRYDEPIEVRRGLVAGQESPEQFIWRDRLWVVREIISHWVETGAWWEQAGVAALLGVGAVGVGAGGVGAGGAPGGGGAGGGAALASELGAAPLGADLLGERELWRVEAGRGRFTPRARTGAGSGEGHGVFDLAFDWGGAQWSLVRSID